MVKIISFIGNIMVNPIAFLPEPRRITPLDGEFTVPAEGWIFLDVSQPQALMFTSHRLQLALQTQLGFYWQRTAGGVVSAQEVGLWLRLSPHKIAHREGYQLSVTPEGICIEAHDEMGLFYGVGTFIQLISQAGRCLPCLEIEDWPDFPARAVMLDISRDKVPELNTLFDLIDRLAGWKINQVQLYTEHTFAYRQHPDVWAKASPLTGEEILQLDGFCRQRYIELVPNQNSFGHMERWLKHERYTHLAEIVGEIHAPWGIVRGPYGLAPVHTGSFQFIQGLYDELLPHFSSRMFNVGCDETFDLGQGLSKEMVAQKGAGRVYLDFLLQIYQDVTRRGYTMQFWGDIITQHPELVPELPKDAIALLWGYEDNHPFDREGAQFAAAGIPFYVCPGTSSWCSLGGRTQNAIANLRNAAENGLKHGAAGFMNTDWGDGGHWQMLPVSYIGLAAGAAFSWCYSSNQQVNIPQAVSRFAFDDRSDTMGKVAYELGNAYLNTGLVLHNSTVYYRLLQNPLEKIAALPEAKIEVLERAMQAVSDAIQPMAHERMTRMDADLIRREFLFTARLMRHACYRGYLALETDSKKGTYMSQQMTTDIKEIINEYRLLWKARNRNGGLEDSIRRFEGMQQEYAGKFLARSLENEKLAVQNKCS